MNQERQSHGFAAQAGEQGEAGEYLASDALGAVQSFAREKPHLALAGAFVAGFVLGGGATPRLLGAFGLLAAKRYLRGTIDERIRSALHEAVAGRSVA